MTKAHFHHAPLLHLVNERATISAKQNSNLKMALFVRHPIRRQNTAHPPPPPNDNTPFINSVG